MAAERIRRWAAQLADQAERFSLEQSPEQAKNILVACTLIKAAVTGYLTKYRTEDIFDGNEKRLLDRCQGPAGARIHGIGNRPAAR